MPISRRRKLILIFSGIAVVLAFAFIIFIAVIGSLFGGSPNVPRNSVLVLEVEGGLPDYAAPDPLAKLFDREDRSLDTLLWQIKKAKVDGRIGGLLLQVDAPLTAGWAKLDEMRDAVADFRTSGKPVYAYMELGLNKEYYLATACDKIFVAPEGVLFTTGLAADVSFYRGALDKLGIYPDVYKIGAYKNAPDSFTRTEMSDEQREVVNAILDDQFNRLVTTIAAARRKSPEDVRAFIDNAPVTPAMARDAGMIDGASYRDDIEEELRGRLGYKDSEKKLRTIAGDTYRQVSPESLELNTGERIGIIYAPGTIQSGESSSGSPFAGESTGSDTLRRALRKAAEDDSIKAIVLRVDSPGGSSIASDVIYHAIEGVKKKKPVVVSMGDYAASGGYYISANANRIVAHPATITGSIGVFAGKPVLAEFYKWVGISNEYVTRGRNAGYFRETEPFTPEERARFEGLLREFYYNGFVPKVAQGRNRSPEYIDSIGQGRVWTGAQARERGLVDEFGGMERAIEVAKELAGIKREDSVRRVVLPAPRPFIERLLGGGFATMKAEGEQQAMVDQLPAEARRALRQAAFFSRIRRGEVMAMLPFEMEIK